MASANAIGFDLGGNLSGNILVSAFDAADVLLGSFNVAITAGSLVFVGLINDSGLISRVTLGGPLGEVIDNVAFGQQAAIPEPASLLLMGAGLGLLARRVRARRR